MFKQVFCNHKTIFLGSWAASVAKGVLVTTNIFVMQYMIDAALGGAFFVSGKCLLAGFTKIDSYVTGRGYTENDESELADLARSLGVNLELTGCLRYCYK